MVGLRRLSKTLSFFRKRLQKYDIRDLPGDALVITFFMHGDFSAKLRQIRMQFLLQKTANNAQLQTQISSYLLLQST